jgi:hypothetical protein
MGARRIPREVRCLPLLLVLIAGCTTWGSTRTAVEPAAGHATVRLRSTTPFLVAPAPDVRFRPPGECRATDIFARMTSTRGDSLVLRYWRAAEAPTVGGRSCSWSGESIVLRSAVEEMTAAEARFDTGSAAIALALGLIVAVALVLLGFNS